MIEVTAKIQLLDTAESEVIGIKEVLASAVEPWSDRISFEIQTSVPSQLDFGNNGEIRPTVTAAAVIEELKRRNLTLKEIQNIVQACVEFTKTES